MGFLDSITRRLADTYYGGETVVMLNKDEQLNLTIGLTVAIFVSMALELSSPEVCFLVALSVLMLAQVLKMDDVLSGFANDGLVTIGSLFLVVGAMEKSHILEYGARLAFGTSANTRISIFRYLSSSFLISALFNNIPQVAIMVPIVKDWAKQKGIPSSQLMMPLSYSVLAGGMLATIGTSTNLVIQGLLTNDKVPRVPFGFFDPGVVGLPAGIILILYMIFAGPYILPHHKDEEPASFAREQNQLIEVKYVEEDVSKSGTDMKLFDFVSKIGLTTDSVVQVARFVPELEVLVANSDGDAGIELSTAEKLSMLSPVVEPDGDIPASQTEASSVFSATFRIINDNIFNSFVDYYRSLKIKIEARYPELFGLSPDSGVVSFYEKDGVIKEVFRDFSGDFVLKADDVITFQNASEVIDKLSKVMPWEQQRLKVFGGIAPIDFPIFGDLVVEVTVSNESSFVGQNFLDVSSQIYRNFISATVSSKGASSILGEKKSVGLSDSAAENIICAGDTLLLITSKEGLKRLTLSTNFASIHEKTRLTAPSTYWSFFPVLSFMVIVSLVAAQKVEMTAAALSMASFFFVGGWIVPKEIEKFVDIRLLMLMGTSLSFAKAMTSTGLAAKIAEAIAGKVSDPTSNLFLIYISTLVITELISNNAAAAMMYPIAVVLADTLGVSYKPYAMVVMQAASMAFMCPIGYPTHVMVWAPGQYNFSDFCKFGFIPNMLWMLCSVLISLAVWPL